VEKLFRKYTPRLLAHATAHYTSSELLYNEEDEENTTLINFESSKISNEIYSENGYVYPLKCKICGDRFNFKKIEIIFSKLIPTNVNSDCNSSHT
jgi:hypothetical protein